MAANAVQIADHEQSIQILKHQNTKLCEQLATKKEQIEALEGSVQKYEEEKKRFADTLLCVNRLWTQFTGDIQTLAKRNAAGAAPAAAAPTPRAADASPNAASLAAAAAQAAAALAAGEQAAAAAAAGDPDAEVDPLVWDSFDPFLARLLQADAASSNRLLKKHTQAYLSELSTVEEALHARAAAGLEALASLLDAIEVGGGLWVGWCFSLSGGSQQAITKVLACPWTSSSQVLGLPSLC
jgi:E3 ubiquitin-protein ligase BRE1